MKSFQNINKPSEKNSSRLNKANLTKNRPNCKHFFVNLGSRGISQDKFLNFELDPQSSSCILTKKLKESISPKIGEFAEISEIYFQNL